MTFIDESSEPDMAHIDRVFKSLSLSSQDTMSLEEDERLLMEDLSQLSEFVSSCLDDEEEDDDDIFSCMSSQASDDMPVFSLRATRVKFSPMASKYLIMSRSEYTQDEIEDTWWTPKQREVINKEHNKTVDRMDSGLKERKSSPYRGLEKIAIQGYQQMVDLKNAYVDTVMDEMERQWAENDTVILDWEKIASLTAEISRKSTQEAVMTALLDENAAREAYQTIKTKDMSVQRSSFSSTLDISDRSELDSSIRDEKEVSFKLDRLDNSLRPTMERGLLVSPTPQKKKKKVKIPKKKTKKVKSSKKQDQGASSSHYDLDGDETEVDFADAFDLLQAPELGEDAQAKKKKKRGKKKSTSKNDEGNISDNNSATVKKTKKKKRKSQTEEKTSSKELDVTLSTTECSGSDSSASLDPELIA